jgi:putative methionine-R-sulfoxide reductase with GAF domain
LGFIISIAILIYAYLQIQASTQISNYYISLIFWAVLGLIVSGIFSMSFLYLGNNQQIGVIYANKALETDMQSEHKENQYTSQDGTQLKGLSVKKLETIIIENQYNKKQLLDEFLRSVCTQIEASVGIIYLTKLLEDDKILEIASTYAYYSPDTELPKYEFGQGLVGQVAKNGKSIQIESVPKGYVHIISGLGNATPNFLMIFPVKNEEKEMLGVIELASFSKFGSKEEKFLNDVALLLAKEIETNEYQKLSL